jgi:hypothetical protein
MRAQLKRFGTIVAKLGDLMLLARVISNSCAWQK